LLRTLREKWMDDFGSAAVSAAVRRGVLARRTQGKAYLNSLQK